MNEQYEQYLKECHSSNAGNISIRNIIEILDAPENYPLWTSKGMGIVESAYSAAQVRLRPILMTVLTMIFGMLPLMFSSGAGANGNSSLGTGVVGGMLVGTLALLFVVPVFYIIFEYLQEKIRPPMEEEADVQVLLEKQKSEAERAKN